MSCKRGDVVLVLFSDSNLRTAKRRPALIVQSDALKTGLRQTIVAMITGNMARAGFPSRTNVSLSAPEGQQSGLKTESVIMTDNLATVLDGEIDRTIGTWPSTAVLDAALRHTVAL